ncbi:AAA family ATPase [Enterobacter cloacae]|uniref:AAA family ATPase n=1 Tax=Enterobacter cloacae TaxID=550 RepID=UPI003D6FF750
MKNSRIIRRLKIEGLFGQYNVNIELNDLTVIVGKNGLGKTTLLKILKGFMTGKHEINYEDICENIELFFEDGNIISFGVISEEMSRSVASKGLMQYLMNDEKGIETIIPGIDGINSTLTDVEKKDIAERLIAATMKSETFLNMLKNGYGEVINKNNKQIFSNKFHIKDIKDTIVVRYISTVNISANAGNNIDFGNSIEKNPLNLAIYDELRILLKNENKSAEKKFKEQLNTFLKESGKKTIRKHGEWIFTNKTGRILGLEQLSSGERQLVYILATAANTCNKATLFLMDEPEISLHLSWQEKILTAIMNINPLMQIIAVTHSPGIIMNGHMDAYVEMKDIMRGVENV